MKLDSRRNAVSFRRTQRHTWTPCAVCLRAFPPPPGHCAFLANPPLHSARAGMSSAQLRLAETIDTFYGASDKTSDSAMAAHAYRRSVEELDAGISRELVRGRPHSLTHLLARSRPFHLSFLSFLRLRTPPIARPSLIRSAG